MPGKKILVVLMSVVLVVAQGCGTPAVNGYRDSSYKPDSNARAVVLPFLDSRSFVDEKDPLGTDVSEPGRKIFIEEMRSRPVFSSMLLIAPSEDRTGRSYTTSELLEKGIQYGGDLVFDGQIFSFTDTRAASIPPRAGYFIRVYSVPEQRFVYIGERYSAAGVPGAEGGREHQARLAAQNILDGFLGASSLPPKPLTLPKVKDGAPKILMLPYFERENPINLSNRTGGGAVATGIYGMELARLGKVEVMNQTGGGFDYNSMPDKETALQLGMVVGADYVVRGQVVEFRRSQSVPSFWSAVVSISILAAQVLFAEVSGVDIATEVYRVSDGECVFARRDISHQKYVVSAEKTVRYLAQLAARDICSAIDNDNASATPLIDSITVPQTEQEIKDAAERMSGETSDAGKSQDDKTNL